MSEGLTGSASHQLAESAGEASSGELSGELFIYFYSSN